MGNCAGCTNPERTIYRNHNPKEIVAMSKISKSKSNSPDIRLSKKEEDVLYAINNYTQSKQFKIRQSLSSEQNDPWKSRIASRSVRKYVRKPTLKQQQSANKAVGEISQGFSEFKHIKQDNQIKSIGTESLQQSIINRYHGSPNEARQKRFKKQNIFLEDPQQLQAIVQNSVEGRNNTNSSQNTFTPVNKKISMQYSMSPIYELEYKAERQRSNNKYLPRKNERHKDRQLTEILELIEKDAETPGYVKNLRKQQGQDIKMNNFQQFNRIENFQWFSIGKYLNEIELATQNDERLDQKLNREKQEKQNNEKLAFEIQSTGGKRKTLLKTEIDQSTSRSNLPFKIK